MHPWCVDLKKALSLDPSLFRQMVYDSIQLHQNYACKDEYWLGQLSQPGRRCFKERGQSTVREIKSTPLTTPGQAIHNTITFVLSARVAATTYFVEVGDRKRWIAKRDNMVETK